MKKDYSKPAMLVVELKHKCRLLQGSDRSIKSVGGNVFDGDIQSDEEYIKKGGIDR